MFIPGTHAIRIAIEGDVPVPRNRFELVDDLPAQRTQIRRPGVDRNALAFAHSGQIEKIPDDVLNVMRATFDDPGVVLRGAPGIGHLLQSTCGDHDRSERIANVVADNRENPPLEVACERELLLVVLLLCLSRPVAIVDVDAAADEPGERSAVVCKGNTSIENPAVDAVVPAEAVFHFERFATMEVVQIVRDAALQISSVHALGPTVAHLLRK